ILQGIGAIVGVPGAIAAFVILFFRDNHKIKQIEALTSISGKLEQSNEHKQQQLDNLQIISSKIESQNETLQKSNELASEQIDVLRKMLLKPGASGYDKLAEIEEKKLKLSVKPNLRSNSQSYRMDELWVDINNYGELAIVDSIDFDTHTFYPINSINSGYELIKNSKIRIGLKSKDGANTNYKNCEIEVFYHDTLDNKYKLRIKRDESSGLFRFQQFEI
ncbi:MAG: hypothetical protein ACK5UI_08455, partial [Bacteroidota bacterium]